MKIVIRNRYLSSEWEVIGRYGCHETLLAVRATKSEAQRFAADYKEAI